MPDEDEQDSYPHDEDFEEPILRPLDGRLAFDGDFIDEDRWAEGYDY